MSTEVAAELDLLKAKDVAAFLQVNERTLEGWRRRRRGPRWIQVGAFIRYRRSDVANWLDAQTEGVSAP